MTRRGVFSAVRGGGAVIAGIGILAAFLLAGCGAPSVEDICDQLDEQHCPAFGGVDACVESGKSIQERVDAQGGCDGAFDAYRACLFDGPSCSWGTTCTAERADLERCIGDL